MLQAIDLSNVNFWIVLLVGFLRSHYNNNRSVRVHGMFWFLFHEIYRDKINLQRLYIIVDKQFTKPFKIYTLDHYKPKKDSNINIRNLTRDLTNGNTYPDIFSFLVNVKIHKTQQPVVSRKSRTRNSVR